MAVTEHPTINPLYGAVRTTHKHTGGCDVIIKFPYNACRRIIARRPRRSKNGTPEERAAKGTPKLAGPSRNRWSKNGSPQQRAAKLAAKLKRSATIIVFPAAGAGTEARECAINHYTR
jgi:hypothetical protein